MPKRVVKGTTIVVKLSDLHELPGPNPNVMTPEQEAQLKASILENGYRQLITAVLREEGGWWISDGVHRKKVLLELGYVEVPVLTKDGTVDTVRQERLALNRIRGGLDLSLAASELRTLEESGLEHQQLAACGFSEDELAVLLKATAETSDQRVLEEGLEAGPAGESSTEAAKRYTLTMNFDVREERDAVRERLLRFGPSIEEGLRQLLGRGTP